MSKQKSRTRRTLIAAVVLLIVLAAGMTSCRPAMIVTKVEASRSVTIDHQFHLFKGGETYSVWVNDKLYIHTNRLYKVGDTLK